MSSASTITFNPTTGKCTVKYDGKSIETIVTKSSHEAFQWFEDIDKKYHGSSKVVVGLETKWSPTSPATLQFYLDDKCLVLQHCNFCCRLNAFFRNSKFCFVGIELEEFNQFLDIGKAAKMKWPGSFSNMPSLEVLAREVGGGKLKRHEHVSKSNWGARMLCNEQVEYACIEAYASYCVGQKLLLNN